MKILQIGSQSWADQVDELPEGMTWYWTSASDLPDFLEELKVVEE